MVVCNKVVIELRVYSKLHSNPFDYPYIYSLFVLKDAADAKWYIQLLHSIYKPREGLLNKRII